MEKEEFLTLLPKLIKEDDQVKGAIITALSGIVATKEDIEKVIKSNKEEIDKLIKSNKEDIKLLISEFDKRFEAMDKRFEALQIQINNNYTELKSAIDNLGDRAGKGMEEMILKLLKEQNKLRKIDFENIERKVLVDEDGIIFPKNFSTDIDILMENGKTILMEIKFKIDNRDLHHFLQVSKLYEALYQKPDELWVLTIEISPKTFNISKSFPFKLIYGKIK